MPGRPTRHKILENFRPETIEPFVPIKPSEQAILNGLIINALLHRLEQVSPSEAMAARGAVALTPVVYPGLRDIHGMEAATGMVGVLLGHFTIKKNRQWQKVMKTNEISVLFESKQLFGTIPCEAHFETRAAWLRDLKMSERFITTYALEQRSELVERILAERHAISKSEIHKLLAKGSRTFREYLKKE